MTDRSELRKPEIRSGRSRWASGVSLVWAVPVVAIVGALGLAWQSYTSRDATIEIEFANAEGIEVGKTEIRFREMKVGTVADMRFSDDLSRIIVEAAINRDMAEYLDEDTKFWLVTARVGPSGISGLNTLLSGAYITAEWDSKKGVRQTRFTAEQEAPIVPPGAKGTAIVINSPDAGSISVGAPILHRGLPMGKVAAVRYSASGDTVLITGFVDAPYDTLLTTATRFWNVSGIGFELGENGIELKVDSLASLLQGGIAFDTTMSGGEKIDQNTVFDLYGTEQQARDSVLGDRLAATVELLSSFEGSVRGLNKGADVVFRGLKIGQVQRISAQSEQDADGKADIQMQVVYTVQPARLGLEDVTTPEQTLSLLSSMVEHGGLRARLVVSSIFSGGLHVELYEDETATPAVLEQSDKPYPVMPSTPTPPDTLAMAAQNVVDRVAALPVEDLMQRAIAALDNVNALISDRNTRQIPADIRAVLDNVNSFTASDALHQLPQDLNQAVASVNAVLDRLEQGGAVQALVESLQGVRNAVANISTASAELPQVLKEIDMLVGKANALPLEDMVTSADQVLQSANGLLSDAEAEKLPAALTGALQQAEATLAELKATASSVNSALQTFDEKQGVDSLIATLEDVRSAVANISTASNDVPQLITDIDAFVRKADQLPLETVVSSAGAVLQSANGFLQNEDLQDVPGALASALDQAGQTLDELRAGGAVANLNRTLDSASTAADAIAQAVQSLPELAKQLEQLADSAEATIGAYGPGSPVNREVQAAITDLRATVRSLNQLVQAIRRKPNSLLVGR